MSFKTSCGTCGEVIMLLKDSTEGQKVFHGGECYRKFQEEKDMKYTEIDSREIEKLTKLTAPDEMNGEKCDYKIQRGGTVWRFVDKNVKPFDISFVCCNCSKLT